METLNDSYKKWHKPNMSESAKTKQGYYTPQLHPEKCLSLGQNIYRSSWEFFFYDWCDRCDSVLRWASEPISIKYKNPVANFDYCVKNHLDWKNPCYWKTCNYNVDVWIELLDQDNKVHKIFVEIKPKAQTIAPVQPQQGAKVKEFKAYNKAAQTYLVNQAKWDAARKFCAERDCEFKIFTEDDFKRLGIRLNGKPKNS